MPGASLWLLPPSHHPLQPILETLIQQTSTHFNSPHLFIPHITLTSNISPSTYTPSAQKWLNDIEFPTAAEVVAKFLPLQSEDLFVKKLYVQVGKSGLENTARVARTTVAGCEDVESAGKWVEEEYRPHLSLLYHDCPLVDEKGLRDIDRLVKDAGVDLAGEGELGGWVGGRVVLVDTSRPVREWVPIAERVL